MRHVFVPSPAEVHDDELVLCHLRRSLDRSGDSVRTFEGGDDALPTRKFGESVERFVVGGVVVFHAAQLAQVSVLGAYGGVVQPGADAVGELDLPILIREQPRLGALSNAELSALKPRRVLAVDDAASACFDAEHFHALVG